MEGSQLAADDWWRSAVIYQVYVRSFADGDGDGTGDLTGVRSRLPYLAELGVDALWFTPWYLSPMADGGYDVADYRVIDPSFGNLAEAEKLIAEARQAGIRTIIDIVPNHVSDQHVWFKAALAAGPGSPERELFHFRPGRGVHGELPPNDWESEFGGVPWTRVEDGQWYLHLFATEQPDLNWAHPAVRQEHEDVLRFWFERGVAGVRIDSAALVAKDPALPDVAGHRRGRRSAHAPARRSRARHRRSGRARPCSTPVRDRAGVRPGPDRPRSRRTTTRSRAPRESPRPPPCRKSVIATYVQQGSRRSARPAYRIGRVPDHQDRCSSRVAARAT
ncbi:hypothetical protein SMICM304S_01672 [Streptomyces microflavus]